MMFFHITKGRIVQLYVSLSPIQFAGQNQFIFTSADKDKINLSSTVIYTGLIPKI